MNTLSRSAAILAVVALLGAGCDKTATQASQTGTEPSMGIGKPSQVASGDCFNLYYPLKTGSSIEYRMKGGSLDIPFKIEVAEHTKDSVKLNYVFSVKGQETSVTNELVCENGNIHGKGYFDFASKLTGIDFTYETVSMKGDILPSDLAVGRSWNFDAETIVHTNDARMKAVIDGKHQKTHAESKVVGEEEVTVPAGTFKALKIDQTIAIDTGISNVVTTTTASSWYVKDIGLVKSQSGADKASGMEATKIAQ